MARGQIVSLQASDSNPSVQYAIRLGADGTHYCSCPAWRFQRGRSAGVRTCKHVNRYLASLAVNRAASPAVVGRAALQASLAASAASRNPRGPADVRNALQARALAPALAVASMARAAELRTIAPVPASSPTPKARKAPRKVPKASPTRYLEID